MLDHEESPNPRSQHAFSGRPTQAAPERVPEAQCGTNIAEARWQTSTGRTAPLCARAREQRHARPQGAGAWDYAHFECTGSESAHPYEGTHYLYADMENPSSFAYFNAHADY